jgi:hypothetical protein
MTDYILNAFHRNVCLSNWVSSREMWRVHANEQINQYHHNSARTLGGFNWCQRVALPKHNQPRQLLKLMSPREVANSLKESVLTLCQSPYEVERNQAVWGEECITL